MVHNITIIPGDGIGPEVTGAARKILDATGVKINWEVCEAGAEVFKKGLATGVPKETIDSIKKNRVVLKGPLETPVGFGAKSANVTLRKMFETYGNIRPVCEMPGVKTPYSGRGIDLVIVRENVEDLYAGIEYMQTPGLAETLKLISEKGCEKIVRLAFEVARAGGRKKLHCATKANIMKQSEGMLKRVFERVAKEYPDIESHHIIIDNCAHQLVKMPEQFDVIVTTNMNGDIMSDLSSALVGGLGFAPGANIGKNIAIFEAVHGSAPKYAGKNNINPTAMIMSAIMMLRYLKEFKAADDVEHALHYTLGTDNIFTRDVVGDEKAASTTEYTDAIIKNLGVRCDTLKIPPHKELIMPDVSAAPDFVVVKERSVDGIDVFIETSDAMKDFGPKLEKALEATPLKLKQVSCRGVVVYPIKDPDMMPDMIDAVVCRLTAREPGQDVKDDVIAKVVAKISENFKWGHIEKLHVFDGSVAYSKAHGEE